MLHALIMSQDETRELSVQFSDSYLEVCGRNSIKNSTGKVCCSTLYIVEFILYGNMIMKKELETDGEVIFQRIFLVFFIKIQIDERLIFIICNRHVFAKVIFCALFKMANKLALTSQKKERAPACALLQKSGALFSTLLIYIDIFPDMYGLHARVKINYGEN